MKEYLQAVKVNLNNKVTIIAFIVAIIGIILSWIFMERSTSIILSITIGIIVAYWFFGCVNTMDEIKQRNNNLNN